MKNPVIDAEYFANPPHRFHLPLAHPDQARRGDGTIDLKGSLRLVKAMFDSQELSGDESRCLQNLLNDTRAIVAFQDIIDSNANHPNFVATLQYICLLALQRDLYPIEMQTTAEIKARCARIADLLNELLVEIPLSPPHWDIYLDDYFPHPADAAIGDVFAEFLRAVPDSPLRATSVIEQLVPSTSGRARALLIHILRGLRDFSLNSEVRAVLPKPRSTAAEQRLFALECCMEIKTTAPNADTNQIVSSLASVVFERDVEPEEVKSWWATRPNNYRGNNEEFPRRFFYR